MRKIFFLLSFTLFINISFAQKSIPNITLQNLENTPVKITDFTENKLIILSFWATWCIPCINELNAISEVYKNWQEETNVQLIAVSIDDNRTISRVRPLINSNEWEYEILFDKNQDLKRALQITNIPYTLIVKNGVIVFQHAGYIPGNEDILFEKVKEFSSN
ncbi:MAG: TlpA family protein disulfide reductase [Flavobacteriaceae bacterium]|nr:TlpA family protein disulfide reductase [Flavobacteriaceae bacterium]